MTKPASRQAGPHRSSRPSRPETKDIAGLAARKTAARLLAAVIDAKTPLDALTDGEHGHPQFLELDARDQALVRAILVTALRHRVTIEKLIARRLDRPLPANAHTLSHVLHVGAAQILFLDIPDSAAVDLAVTHAKSDPRTNRFANLVNALLRGIARTKDRQLAPMLAETRDAPDWFVERLQDAYGMEMADAILAAHRVEPPVDFTVKDKPKHWAEKLGGIVLPTGSVRVARLAAPVRELPGFEEGAWWVQDTAASLPARLLGPVKGLRVADICAAPGGKTAQLALAGAEVTAIDISGSRLKRLSENLLRLGLCAEIVEADLRKYEPPALFDAVLLDAPCSSTGTVRRHPDVPWTKSPADIAKLAELQRNLLGHAMTFVRPGGLVVFSNCSLDPLEGEELVAGFLADGSDVALDPIMPDEFPGIAEFVTPLGTLRTTPVGLSSADPRMAGLDGFYAARLRRRVA